MTPEEDSIKDLFNILRPEQITPRSGWQITPTNGFGPDPWVKRDDSSEQFRLADRPLAIIDAAVQFKLTALLIRTIKENPGRKIRFMDLGGGVRSRLVRDILKHPQFKGKIQATNIDPFAQELTTEQLVAEGINANDLTIARRDLFEMAVEPESADIVFSWQFLDHLTGEHLVEALNLAALLLAPGGVGLLQEQWKTNRGFGDFDISITPGRFPRQDSGYLQKIADRHNCMIESSYGETTLDGRTHIFGAGTNLLVLLKGKYGKYPNFRDFNTAFPEIEEVAAWCRTTHKKILEKEKEWQDRENNGKK